jgi:[ribosomal protein S5]-alanine N-acetyltransferase
MTDFSTVSLSTDRLTLRPLRNEDAVALYSIFSNEQVMRFWSSTPWNSLEVSKQFIERDKVAMAEGKHLRLAIVANSTNSVLGTCTLFDHISQCRRAEVGFGLSPEAWGQGYVFEAVSEILLFGFTAMSLNRVEADIDPRNGASAKSLERLGFKKEGHLRERWIVGNEVSDSAIYGLLHRDWCAARRSGA